MNNKKIQFLFATLLLISLTSVYANKVITPEPLYRPIGLYQYQNDIQITKKRTAETVSHQTNEGQVRIKELKRSGFICVRKNQIDSICQKNEFLIHPIPDFVQKAVDQYFQDGEMNFPGTAIPALTFDGATQEWFLRETIKIGSGKVEMYKIVNTNDQVKRWFLSLPISETNGIGLIEIKNQNLLAIPMVLQSKSNNQTIGYFIDAYFKHESL